MTRIHQPLQNNIHLPQSTLKGFNVTALLLCISLLFFCISQTLLRLDSPLSLIFKALGFFTIILSIIFHGKINKKIYWLAPVLGILLLNLHGSYSTAAALEEMLRFLFPILIIVALYKNNETIKLSAKFLVAVTLTNNIYQAYFYLAHMAGLTTMYEAFYDMGYIIRAEGWVGSFTLFGLMNFFSFIIVRHGNIFEKKSKPLEWTFITFALLSTTTKIFAAFLIYLIIMQKTKSGVRLTLSIITLALIASTLQPKLAADLVTSMGGKVSVYIIQGESARADSYRVMKESLLSPNFFGEGLGTFGGPASIEYNSPLYNKYNFNWYGLETLATTDTFYPHLFVELGLIGGILYLLFLFSYGQPNKTKLWQVVAIAFMVENISSFSMLAPPNFLVAAITLSLFSRQTTSSTAQMIKVR